MKRIESSSEGVTDTVGGKYVTFPIRTKRNPAIMYRDEEGLLAPPGQQSYAAVQVKLKYGYGRFKVTGQVMELADTNFQAFSSMLDEEMNGLKDDLVKDENRIAYGNSNGNAVMAMITDTATATAHTVDNVQYLSVGQVVDVLVVATGSATGGIASVAATPVTITAINTTTKTVTFSASFGPTTAGHGIYRAGDRNVEPTGFAAITNATLPLYGLDPALEPTWAGNTLAIGGALAETNMIKACDLARTFGGKTSVIFTSLGVRRAYFNLLTQQRRYNNTQTFEGGFVGLPFNYGTEIPVVEDVDAPPSTMFFMDESKIKKYRRKPWYFADDDGAVLKWDRDYDRWEGLMKCYWEIGTSMRRAHVSHTGVTEA
jgi:hypothetical protein